MSYKNWLWREKSSQGAWESYDDSNPWKVINDYSLDLEELEYMVANKGIYAFNPCFYVNNDEPIR